METCEWNPATNGPANLRETGNCTNQATVSVSSNFHLCERCAALPKFKRFKKWCLVAREEPTQ
jgi:hypothetical protein